MNFAFNKNIIKQNNNYFYYYNYYEFGFKKYIYFSVLFIIIEFFLIFYFHVIFNLFKLFDILSEIDWGSCRSKRLTLVCLRRF